MFSPRAFYWIAVLCYAATVVLFFIGLSDLPGDSCRDESCMGGFDEWTAASLVFVLGLAFNVTGFLRRHPGPDRRRKAR